MPVAWALTAARPTSEGTPLGDDLAMEMLALRPLRPDAPALTVEDANDDAEAPWKIEIRHPGHRLITERFHWLGAALVPASDHLCAAPPESVALEMAPEIRGFLACGTDPNRTAERTLLFLGNPHGLRDLQIALERAGSLGIHVEGRADEARASLGTTVVEIAEADGRNVEARIGIRQGDGAVHTERLPLSSLRAALPAAARADAPNALLRSADSLYIYLPTILPTAERQVRDLANAFADAGVRMPTLADGLFGICRAALAASDRLRGTGDARADALERVACLAWRGYALSHPAKTMLRDPLAALAPIPPARPGSRFPSRPSGTGNPIGKPLSRCR